MAIDPLTGREIKAAPKKQPAYKTTGQSVPVASVGAALTGTGQYLADQIPQTSYPARDPMSGDLIRSPAPKPPAYQTSGQQARGIDWGAVGRSLTPNMPSLDFLKAANYATPAGTGMQVAPSARSLTPNMSSLDFLKAANYATPAGMGMQVAPSARSPASSSPPATAPALQEITPTGVPRANVSVGMRNMLDNMYAGNPTAPASAQRSAVNPFMAAAMGRMPSMITPAPYESKTSTAMPNRQAIAQQAMANARQATPMSDMDIIQRAGGAIMSPALIQALLQDRQQGMQTGAAIARDAGSQANDAQRAALEQAKINEQIGQAEYASQWKAPEYEADVFGKMAQAANQADNIQTARERIAALEREGAAGRRAQATEGALALATPDQTGMSALQQFLKAMAESGKGNAVADAYAGIVDPLLQAYMADGLQTYADGGEVEVETEVSMGGEEDTPMAIDPTAEGKAAGMDSGDYVFPVEAVRFYGTKMLKGMMEKAMMADDD